MGEFPASIDVHGNLDLAHADWSSALQNIDVVIHCAARVHIMNDTSINAIDPYRKINVDGTMTLARKAALLNIKRFVYLSSVKVNGDNTDNRSPFAADETVNPTDPYGISKHETETGLIDLAKNSNLEIVIIRPPLVYGPGVKANFLSMMNYVNKSIPLPFGLIKNKRSFVSIDNLADFVQLCCHHPAAKNEVFMVSDGHDLSTTQLLRLIAHSLNKKTILLPIPPALIKAIAILFGQRALIQRLIGSLQVDIAKNRRLLNWTPRTSVEAALERTARDYLQHLDAHKRRV